jgi:signal peptidase I
MDLNLSMKSEPQRVEPPAVPAPVVPAKKPLLSWRTVTKALLTWLLVAAFTYCSFVFATNYIVQSVQVVGNSMSPTLEDSHRYVLNRWVYHMRDPKPGDIVVLRDPTDNGYAIKRVIAGAGDSVYIKGGHIYVNGKELFEPYLKPGTPTYPGPQSTEQWFICGKDKYFVLGDNRNNSCDSRIYNAVPKENILGMVTP